MTGYKNAMSNALHNPDAYAFKTLKHMLCKSIKLVHVYIPLLSFQNVYTVCFDKSDNVWNASFIFLKMARKHTFVKAKTVLIYLILHYIKF